MTTETVIEAEANPIDQTQAEMDAVQAGNADAPAAQYVTVEQYNELKAVLADTQEMAKRSDERSRGIQGRVDADRATVQREREAETRQQRLTVLESQLPEVDAATQPFAQAQIDREREELARLRQTPTASEPQSEPLPAGQANDGLEDARAFVRQNHLDPASSVINYNLLFGAEDVAIRSQRFIDHVFELRQKGQQAPAAPVPQQQVPPSPPVGQTPTAGAGVSDFEDLRDQYLTGQITKESYRARAAEMGHSV